MIHILTGEYPPLPGGVSDYTALIARKLIEQGAAVQVSTGSFGLRGLFRLDRDLAHQPKPRRLIVQWTPHSFGLRSLNLLFPLWLWKRAKIDQDRVEVMVHEPCLAFREGTRKQDLAAAVHRVMITVLLAAAAKVWVSIPAWETRLRPWCFGRPKEFAWLPVPSNIDTAVDPAAVRSLRSAIAPLDGPVIGHFGTYQPSITRLLAPALQEILERTSATVVLAGAGGQDFYAAFAARHPHLKDRFVVTGALPGATLARVLSACDVLLQPYPDGISTRRGTAMAALALGLPVVTNLGPLSETLWLETAAVAVASSIGSADLTAATLHLLADPARRLALAHRARELYLTRFDVGRTVAALLANAPRPVPRLSRAAA